jgi:hypothetical protein
VASFAISSAGRTIARTTTVFAASRSAVASSWSLLASTAIDAQLVVRPFFSGCGPRSYRDVGFHFDSEKQGGRLTWLPNVRGPKILADTNGRYQDEPIRSFDCFCEKAAASGSEEDLVTPGRFEFERGRRPSVLIFSIEGLAKGNVIITLACFWRALCERTVMADLVRRPPRV